jgi:hypothetical protein
MLGPALRPFTSTTAQLNTPSQGHPLGTVSGNIGSALEELEVGNCGAWNVTIKSLYAVSSIARLTARSRRVDSYLSARMCERQRSLLVTVEAYTIAALSATL